LLYPEIAVEITKKLPVRMKYERSKLNKICSFSDRV